MIHIGGRTYEIVHEHRTAWNPEMFRDRYSEVLDRYDYIVGDWGYNQLRLKGFFKDNHPKSTKDSALSSMMDYINEYCNFGCAYFILEKKPSKDGRGRMTERWTDADNEGAAAAEELGEMSDIESKGISLTSRREASVEDGPDVNPSVPESRAERHRRAERQFRLERAERQEKQERERNGRSGKHDKQARMDQDRGSRGERSERSERKSNRQQRGRYKSGKPNAGSAHEKPQAGGNHEAGMARPADGVRS